VQFNSVSFFVFAALFFGILSLLPARPRNLRWGFLTFASFVFYGWWDWRYLSLLIISGLIDFVAASKIARQTSRKKSWLAVSIVANLGILGIFKY